MENRRVGRMTHSAAIRCMSRHPMALTTYSGCLPNSSLKDVVTSGRRAKPRVYVDSPTVAWKRVAPRSRSMDGNPRAYAPEDEARTRVSACLHSEYAHKRLPVMIEKNDAVTVIAHFRA